jgi:hypothetical protein
LPSRNGKGNDKDIRRDAQIMCSTYSAASNRDLAIVLDANIDDVRASLEERDSRHIANNFSKKPEPARDFLPAAIRRAGKGAAWDILPNSMAA